MNPEAPRFGREAYEKVDGSVKEVENSQAEKEERVKQLRQELAKGVGNGMSPAEIIALAQEMKSLEEGILSDQIKLEETEAGRESFYGDMQENALTENSLRDELIDATREGAYTKVAEIAEKLVENEQGHLPPTAINQHLEKLGIPASLDAAIEGGVITIEISPELIEALQTWETAKAAYKEADGGSASVTGSSLDEYPWQPPTTTTLETLIVNHGETTPAERDTLVAAMDQAGYRPLTLAELTALTITKPDLDRREEYFNTYELTSVGVEQSPFFNWDGAARRLGAFEVSAVWDGRSRFLFVSK